MRKILDCMRKNKINKIIKEIEEKSFVKRYLMLICGCFILAVAFNLFFLNYDIVCLGMSGVSIILSKFGVEPSSFLLVSNIVLLIIAYLVLGKESAKNQLVGSIVYPIFINITSYFTRYIDFGNTEIIVIAILGGVTAGIGYGLIYKSNFSSGGTDVIIEIICKYMKISMGIAGLATNVIIILAGKLVFSWDTVLYALLVSYLISVFTDKILLGISKSKAFYIVVDDCKAELVKKYLLSVNGVGVTIINALGGYSSADKTLFLAVVPTRSYYIVKEGLKEIDKDVFFLVCDSYEVSNDQGDYLCQ